jgi:hypothetical protein
VKSFQLIEHVYNYVQVGGLIKIQLPGFCRTVRFFFKSNSLTEDLGLIIIDYGSSKLLLEVTSSGQNTHTMLVNELIYANGSPLLLGSLEDQFVYVIGSPLKKNRTTILIQAGSHPSRQTLIHLNSFTYSSHVQVD